MTIQQNNPHDKQSVPMVSVVTVCYNSAKTLSRTIESVRAQSYPNIEYIVIDGGSSDGTVDIIRANEDIIASWVSEPDKGIYDAMNKGVQRANGAWIHILNSDDHYASAEALAKAVPLLDPLQTNYFSIFRETNGTITGENRYPYQGWKMYVSAKLPHPGLIVSREQYKEIGLYDTSLYIAADHDFILKMVKRYTPNFSDFPLVTMDQSGVSASNLELSYREFTYVTIRHGIPRPLAWSIYWLKRLRWRV